MIHQQTREFSSEATGETLRSTERQLSVVSSLMENLQEATCANQSPQARQDSAHQNRLVLSRLGMASALFVALRAKHAATAAHSLRVALTCSAWSFLLELSDEERDVLEVAALLHDVGKIGIPDRVLLKPGELSAEEIRIMHRHRDHTRDILSTCCTSQEIVDTICYSGAWFDGRSQGFDRHGEDLPRTARILAISEAFDAMTTNHVYRRAMSRERAVTEMFEHAGTQFDPQLIRKFVRFLGSDHDQLRASVMSHWLQELRDGSGSGVWQLRAG
ncbi:MAG: HD domain-containing protein, partial [Planctomycetota bacterium]|nr:HD domain-containing protein [Planctomycetota bacterium]